MPFKSGVYKRCAVCDAFVREGSVLCPACRNGSKVADETIRRTTEWLPLDGLEVPKTYQRRQKDRLVRHIVRNFDEAQIGLLTVCRAEDGRQWLLDGQHRWLALAELGRTEAFCEILRNLSLERQAEVFSGRNKRRIAVDHLDAFRADHVAGKPEAVAVAALLRRHGYGIAQESRRPNADQVVCVTALAEIHAWGVLDQTLTLVRAAWPDDAQATQAAVLQGVAAVLRLYPGLDLSQLAASWGRHTAVEVLSRARMRRAAVSDGRAWAHVAAVLVEMHNHGRRAERRLSWYEIPSAAARDWKERRL
jgi:uncharacterized protein DUF6551